MKNIQPLLLFTLIVLISCTDSQSQTVSMTLSDEGNEKKDEQKELNPDGSTILDRYNPPFGYERNILDSNSFGYFLRRLPLFEIDHVVNYYNGEEKSNAVYSSVVDLPIGSKDLHQCADAVMRLRADFLRSSGQQSRIAFHFTNGFLCDYKSWLAGKNINVSGNKVSWSQSNTTRSDSDENYWKYLEKVFTYAGTLSLSKELKPKPIIDIAIGDVFIQGGSPGHAVIVVDVVIERTSGNKQFLLAQSYMPAQEIQILKNPEAKNGSSWFTIPENGVLRTPEWLFSTTDLKSFE